MTEPTTDEVDRQISDVEAKIRSAVEDWMRNARSRSIERLAHVLAETAEAHERARSLLGDSPSDEQILLYRHELLAEVLKPLRERLAADRPGQALEAEYKQLTGALQEAASLVTETVDRPEPAALYAPDGSDALIRRLRKSRVRTGRRVREWRHRAANAARGVTGRPRQDAADPVQKVPLGQLVSFHVSVRLPSELSKHNEEVCRAAAHAVSRVGRAATELVHAVLEQERRDAAAESVHADADRFHAVLEESAALLEAFEMPGAGDDELDDWDALLQRDVRESGTFMLDLSRRDLERGHAIRRRAAERFEAWSAWFERTESRILLLESLIELKSRTGELEKDLVQNAIHAGVEPARDALMDGAETLRELSERAQADFEGGMTAEGVSGRLDEGLEAVERVLAVLAGGQLSDAIETACDEGADDLRTALDVLPEELELNALEKDGAIDPERTPKRVPLREHAERAFDALLMERLRHATHSIVAALATSRGEAESVPSILRFNLGAAADDLNQSAGSDAYGAARELVVDGLARAADVLSSSVGVLNGSLPAFENDVRDVVESGFAVLHQRVRVEERMREQMLDLKTGAEASFRQTARRASAQSRRLTTVIRKAYRTGRREVNKWVRLGQAAAGLAAVTEEERLETVDALAETDQLLDDFPLVYRRLFTFDPVRDPALLEGRETELRFVRKHVDRWQRGLTNALVITGFHGSGQTSFLNVARRTVLADADVHVVDLRRRIRAEADLVDALAEALQADGPASTLDEFADMLYARKASDAVPVCIVEHMEHLYLRQIGGTALIEAFLSFLSRTDSRVLWIATVSDYGWQVIRKAEPSASSLVVVQPLAPLGRDSVESIILNRHRRSGLPLRFDVPTADANPLFLRRYRKAQTEADRQTILRTEYFDRLQRASGQNVMLALLYWLRSIEVDEEEGLLCVRPVEPLRFGFLQTFELDHAFTLKSLLEHASLTVEEHSEVFHVQTERSIEIFEALGNLLLIEPMADRHLRSRFAFATVEGGVRYRVRPLLIHPIIQYLRGKNILH